MSEYGKWWVTLNLLGLLLVSPVAPLKIGDPWVFDGFPRKVHFGADFTSADQVLRIHMRCVAAVAPQIVQICTVCFKSNPWKSKFCKTTILKYLYMCIHTCYICITWIAFQTIQFFQISISCSIHGSLSAFCRATPDNLIKKSHERLCCSCMASANKGDEVSPQTIGSKKYSGSKCTLDKIRYCNRLLMFERILILINLSAEKWPRVTCPPEHSSTHWAPAIPSCAMLCTRDEHKFHGENEQKMGQLQKWQI